MYMYMMVEGEEGRERVSERSREGGRERGREEVFRCPCLDCHPGLVVVWVCPEGSLEEHVGLILYILVVETQSLGIAGI